MWTGLRLGIDGLSNYKNNELGYIFARINTTYEKKLHQKFEVT